MLEMLTFSLAGTVAFAGIAIALIYLMASLGGGQRIHGGSRPQSSRETRRPRPRRQRK